MLGLLGLIWIFLCIYLYSTCFFYLFRILMQGFQIILCMLKIIFVFGEKNNFCIIYVIRSHFSLIWARRYWNISIIIIICNKMFSKTWKHCSDWFCDKFGAPPAKAFLIVVRKGERELVVFHSFYYQKVLQNISTFVSNSYLSEITK